MICFAKADQEKQIASLAGHSSFPAVLPLSLAWMPSGFQSASTFCAYDERTQKLKGAIAWSTHTLFYQNRRLKSAMLYYPAADDPDDQSTIRKLFDAALDVLQCNVLLFYLWAPSGAYIPQTFGQTASLKAGTLLLPPGQYQVGDVRIWNGKEDLYPLYLQFMDNFEASFRFDRTEFSDLLQSLAKSRREQRIYVLYDAVQRPKAFVLAIRSGRKMVLYGLVYDSPDSLEKLVYWFGSLWKELIICYTGAECLERIFPFSEISQPYSLYACCSLPLMRRYLGDASLQFESVWDRLEKPVWALLM